MRRKRKEYPGHDHKRELATHSFVRTRRADSSLLMHGDERWARDVEHALRRLSP